MVFYLEKIVQIVQTFFTSRHFSFTSMLINLSDLQFKYHKLKSRDDVISNKRQVILSWGVQLEYESIMTVGRPYVHLQYPSQNFLL